MLQLLVTALLVSLAINLSMFLVAYRLRSDKLTDISYAVTFIAIAAFSFLRSSNSAVPLILTAMIFIWAVRLGSFLLYRVIKKGKDSRFDGVRENFFKFANFWGGQALTVWVLMIPAIFAFNESANWSMLSLIGVVIWVSGFLLETTADIQKMRFRSRDCWIDSGVWQYSRHPNYFGEILVWVGVYVYVVSYLTTTEAIIGLISPIFITVLLLFVSGVPILEKSADKRWGNLKDYKEYKRRTSILIPFPKKR